MSAVEFPTESGGRVFVEVDPGELLPQAPGGPVQVGGQGGRLQRVAARTWEQSLSGLTDIVSGALARCQDVRPEPDQVEVSFGVALHGEADVKVVKAATDSHLQITAVWKRNGPAREKERGKDAGGKGPSATS